MEFAIVEVEKTAPVEVHLLKGCCLEAERADIVWFRLEGLKAALNEQGHPHLDATIEEIRKVSNLLRELADLSQVHQDRVPVTLDHLNIVLPCLSRSLRDITSHYEDKKLTKQNRWRKMYHQMTNEIGGIPLPQRFVLYNQFLTLLRDLLARSPNFDLNASERLRNQILDLRKARGIPPPPVQVGPLVRYDALPSTDFGPVSIPVGMHDILLNAVAQAVHWAEHIFSLPLPSRTGFKSQHTSKSLGPHRPWGHLNTPPGSKVLFRRSFNEDKIALIVYLDGRDQCPYFLLRTFHMGGPWYSRYGAHELVIERDHCSLRFKRWSKTEGCSKLWAILHFMTWEEMVLMYCTFISLKAINPLTVNIGPEEYHLRGEKRLFQATIIDDGFKHSLIVYQDRYTNGFRLHAAIWGGEFRRSPVWTAFVTHQSASPTWLKRVSRHKIRLADIQLYVFCQKYQQQNQRRGSAGAFEIHFASEEASYRFKDVFHPPSDDESPSSPSERS
ncbi:hypothetical protein S40285_00703 [Stachybotrys chlorohalonatus IBT 40285]|uniref:Uncharacterized protein n=1 Tax=Stachybotrys chlorohalonatus (strain IBT 40285) TaxID=1283841 RepID=A0A084QRG5_STAC4|nr:hypothetical protein S40285_00703 [Stachybotrys chlorohalonata IBT 40285]